MSIVVEATPFPIAQQPLPKAVVQDHLETCPTCAYWEQTAREAIQAMGTDADVEAPEPLRRVLEVKMQEREVEHV